MIDAVLDAISPGSAVYLNRNTADAAYAGYVFSLLLRAAERIAEPSSVRLGSSQISPPQPNVFVFRGAPGALYSRDQNFGFGAFKYEGEDYEIHVGVQYRGSSAVLHEFDISILPSKAADESRDAQEPPGPARARALLECKFYSNSLGIELARELVGLRSDFTQIPIVRLVTNSDSNSVALFLKKTSRPKFSRHVEPANPGMEQEFVCALADELRNVL